MKSISPKARTLMLTMTLALSSCSLIQKPHVTGNAEPAEEVMLTFQEDSDTPSAKSWEVGAAMILLEVGKVVVGAVGDAIEDYGKKFDAEYGASLVAGRSEGSDLTAANLARQEFELVRNLRFDNPQSASAAFAKAGLPEPALDTSDPKVAKVPVLVYNFKFEKSKDGDAIRLINTNVQYVTGKAFRLKNYLKDKPKLSFVITLNGASKDGPFATSFTVPAVDATNADALQASLLEFNNTSPWVTLPPSSSFIMTAKVLETGKGKEWAKKAADALRSNGNKALEKQFKTD